MGIIKSIGGSLARPYTEVFKSGKSLVNTAIDAGHKLQAVHKHTMDKHTQEASPVVKKARTIKSDKQRFEFLYEQHGWTSEKLDGRLRLIKTKQAIFCLFTLMMLIAGFGTLYFAQQNLIFSIVCTILFTFGVSILGAAVIHQGLLKTQIKERELMSWLKFAGRNDFWKAAFLPF